MAATEEPLTKLGLAAHLVLSIFLIAVLQVNSAYAQGASENVELYRLRPADTSSPRDTFRSFVDNANELVRLQLADGPRDERYFHLLAAIETLDFSTIADGGSWNQRYRRVLLLRAVLGRLELPPFDRIPGKEDVARSGMDAWTVPGTRLRIARQTDGLRKGEFLFSSDSVAQLGLVYRRVKDQPYRPGMDSFYEDWLGMPDRSRSQAAVLRNHFKGLDTSSPRSTLSRFLESVNRAYRLVMETEAALQASPPQMTIEEAIEFEDRARNLLRRAADGLDLSQVPEARREDVGIEAVLQLKELLDRVVLPPIEAVPDADALARAAYASPFRYVLPDTGLEIVEMLEGDRAGNFLFSAETVARIPEFYEKLKHLPYYQEYLPTDIYEYASGEISDGFYEFYRSTPGQLIPSTTLLGRLVTDLPDWLKETRGGQTTWQWIALVLFAALVALMAGAVVYVVSGLARRLTVPADSWVWILAPALVALIVAGAVRFIAKSVNITGDALAAVVFLGNATIILMTAWLAYGLCLAVVRTAIGFAPFQRQSSEAGLIRIGAHVLGFLVGAGLIIWGVRDLGADLIPLVAGLGVGGLAIALAVRPTLENVFGGIVLFANKPIRPGDFCRYGDQIGTVEYIGWISTRIRSIDRTLVTVPNGELSQMKLENFAQRNLILWRCKLELRRETTDDQLRFVLAKFRELLLSHPKVSPDPARVRFAGLGQYSLDLDVFVYMRTVNINEFYAILEDVLLRMMRILDEAGTGFAIPMRASWEANAGLDADRARAAEAMVEEWRRKGKLPFPEFEEEESERLEDILDYPPKGSPNSDPLAGGSVVKVQMKKGAEQVTDDQPRDGGQASKTSAADRQSRS